jgi:RNA polymerase sigma-70 factor, ECF subfamily
MLPNPYNSCSRFEFWPVHSYATGRNGNGARCKSRTENDMPAEALAVPFAVGKRAPEDPKPGRREAASESQEARSQGLMAGHSLGRIDDTVLVREAQRGNRAAFEELVRHYDQAVLRLAMHLTGSDTEAQDIYQEAFLKAYKNVGNFRFECSFYTWIYRIVTNLCLDHLRKRQVRKEDAPVATDASGEQYDVLEQVPDARSGANPERDLMRRELGGRISKALEKLTPRERMVFELKHYHGLKLRTVGEVLNTTEETAKNTLFRATQKLRGALADMR